MRIEADLVHQNVERSFANLDLTVFVGGLPDLVEGHHNDGRAELFNRIGFRDEVLFPLLQRDGIDDALALAAFQPGLNHFEVGGVLDVKEQDILNNCKLNRFLEKCNSY